MKHLFFKTIIVIVLFLFARPVFGGVVINEIAWMGTTISANDEWIELYNNGAEAIDLTNWTLKAIDDTPNIVLVGTIPADGYFLLERTDDTTVPSVVADKIYTGALVDGGETLELKNADGTVIDQINCSMGWTKGNLNTKQTMEKATTGWQTSANAGGTPKGTNSEGATEDILPTPTPETTPETTETPEIPATTTNDNPPIADAGDNIIGFVDQEILFDGSLSSDADGNELSYSWNTGDGNSLDKISLVHKYPYPGIYLATLTVFDGKYYSSDTITIKIQQAQITINEFMANPSGTDEEEEWIEIYNGADSISDISGWQLDDIVSGSKAFVFPQNTLIAPKSYLVFSRQTTKIALNNDIDSVRLLMPDGIVFQEIKYEKPPQGKSSARTEEGFVWSEPTPGMANISGISINPTKQTVSQMNIVEPQITKNSTKTYTIDLPKNEIEGGYITNNDQFLISNDQTPVQKTNQLAGIKQSASQNPLNLTLLIICIVFGAGFIGLLLIKFRKKRLPQP